MAKRLTDKHPTYQKLLRLEALANELGLQIEYDGYRMWVVDNERGDRFVYKDIEGVEVSEWPCTFEWKLVIPDP